MTGFWQQNKTLSHEVSRIRFLPCHRLLRIERPGLHCARLRGLRKHAFEGVKIQKLVQIVHIFDSISQNTFFSCWPVSPDTSTSPAITPNPDASSPPPLLCWRKNWRTKQNFRYEIPNIYQNSSLNLNFFNRNLDFVLIRYQDLLGKHIPNQIYGRSLHFWICLTFLLDALAHLFPSFYTKFVSKKLGLKVADVQVENKIENFKFIKTFFKF